ncbi:hypothetical protein MC885_017440 [Smutsia gigantea]|nr:hypothetical protein MC885_017440 [Smutsia gigantea]
MPCFKQPKHFQSVMLLHWPLGYLAIVWILQPFVIFLLFKPLWPVPALYFAWFFLDWKTPEQGGRSSAWVRNWCVWTHIGDYFPTTILKTKDLSPEHNYIMGVHPHGLLTLVPSATSVLRPQASRRPSQASHPTWRHCPGVCSVSQAAIDYLLSCGTGNLVGIVVGGVGEALQSVPSATTILLQRRKGFVCTALWHRDHLVPTFTFGETEVYDQVLFHEDSRRRGFHRGSSGLLPYSLPIITVGESCFQPKATSPPHPTPPHQRRGKQRERSWELTWDVRGSGPRREKVKGREDSNTCPSLFPSLLAVGEPLTLPKIENLRWWTSTTHSIQMPCTNCLTSIRYTMATQSPKSCFSSGSRGCAPKGRHLGEGDGFAACRPKGGAREMRCYESSCLKGRAASVRGDDYPPAAAILRQGHQCQGGCCHVGQGPATPAELPELMSILVPSEQVEHRIQAAVGAGQRPSHFVDQIDNVQHLAVGFHQPCHVIDGAGDMERHEADSKDGQHHSDGADRSQTSR